MTLLQKNNPNRIESFFYFVISALADSVSTLGLISSVGAGSIYSIAYFINQELEIQYYGEVNASIDCNSTINTTSDQILNNQHQLIANKFFTTNKLGSWSYNVQEFITPKTLFEVSGYAITFGIICNFVARMIHTWVDSKDYGTSFIEYLSEAIDCSINTIATAFLTSTLISIGILIFSIPGKPYTFDFPDNNGTIFLNDSSRPKNIIKGLKTFSYENSDFTHINPENPIHRNLNIPIKKELSLFLIVNILLAYTTKVSIVNQGESPNIALAAAGTTILFLASRYLKKKKAERRIKLLQINIEALENNVKQFNIDDNQPSPFNIDSSSEIDIESPPALDNTQAQRPYSLDDLDMIPLASKISIK